MMRTGCAILLLLACATSVPASAQRDVDVRNADIENIGDRDINDAGSLGLSNASDFTLEEEIELGRSMAAELEANVTVLDDGLANTFVATDPKTDTPVVISDDVAITDYVDGVGQRLVASSDARVPFTFRVIEDASINGLALPGGFVYVNTGLLGAARSEAELASALAHLIAHVTARHGVENATKSRLLNIVSIPLIFVGNVPRGSLDQVAGIAVPMSLAKFSRGAVEEADFLGLQYLYTAGYDPDAAVTFLESIQTSRPGDDARVSPIFATHPSIADRIDTIRTNIESILPQRDTHVVTTPEFTEMQARLAARETSPSYCQMLWIGDACGT